jgi:hypothetical protein
MRAFPKPLPDTPHHLDAFTIGAAVSEDPQSGAPVVTLVYSLAIVSAAGRTHQLNGDLGSHLSPAQIAAFTNTALSLYAQAKADLLT